MWWLNDEHRAASTPKANRPHEARVAVVSPPAPDPLARANAELRAPDGGSSINAKRLTAICAQLQQAVSDRETAAQACETRLAEQRRDFETKLAENQRDFDVKLAEQQRASEIELTANRQGHATKLAEHLRECEARLAEQQRTSALKLAEQQKSFEAKLVEQEQTTAIKLTQRQRICDLKLAEALTSAQSQWQTREDQLNHHAAGLQSQITQLEKTDRQRESKLNQAKAAFDAQAKESQQRHAEEVELLQSRIDELKGTCRQHESAFSRLEKRLGEFESEAVTQLTQVQANFDAKNAELRKSSISLADLEIVARQRESEVIQLRESMSAAAEQFETRLAAAHHAFDAEKSDLKAEQARVTEQLSDTITKLQLDAQRQAAERQEIEGSPTQPVAELMRELRQPLHRNEQLRAEEVTELRRQVASAELRGRELEASCQAQQSLIAEREAALVALRRSHDAAEASKNCEIESLQQQLRDLRSDCDAHKELSVKTGAELKRRDAMLVSQSAAHFLKLGQHRYQSTKLQADNSRLRDQVSVLAESLETAIKTGNEQSDAREREDNDALAKSELLQRRVDELTAHSQSLTTRLQRVQEELVDVRRRRAAEKTNHDKAVAMAWQLKATVAWLEENAASMQNHLQRQAAARRKAEAALKREAISPDVDPATHDAWTKIDADAQAERLNREIEAARAMLKFEQRRVLEQEQNQGVERKRRDKPAA